MICVYAAIIGSERVFFVNELARFVEHWGCQDFTICEDFNAVLRSDEKWGVNGFDAALANFVSFV